MNRRSFLPIILAFGVAPAIVRASSLMKVKALPSGVLYFGFDPADARGDRLAIAISYQDTISDGMLSTFYSGEAALRACRDATNVRYVA